MKSRNGLLPKLNLVLTGGLSGSGTSADGAFADLDGRAYDAAASLTFERPLGNRSARASHTRALLSREEASLSVENLRQQIQVEVRTSYIAATTAREQIAATAATRALKEAVLRAEEEKFRVGRTTSFQVAQAQRDFTASQIAEVDAVAGYLKALVELFRVDGTLLDRRGLAAPGAVADGTIALDVRKGFLRARDAKVKPTPPPAPNQ